MLIETRKPAEIPAPELEAIRTLVAAGGEVDEETLACGLRRAHLIFTARDGDRIVGMLAAKSPMPGYLQKVATRSGYSAITLYRYEGGYSYVAPDYRGRGLAGYLVDERTRAVSKPLFVTVRVENVLTIGMLQRRGFRRVGKSWQGRRGELCLLLSGPEPGLLRRWLG